MLRLFVPELSCTSSGICLCLVNKYSYLVNGEAAEAIQQFMQGENSFQDYCEQVEKYRKVAAEISDLDSIVNFQMVSILVTV